MVEKNAKIYVAGHKGLVGSAIVRELTKQGYRRIITRTSSELDLCDQQAVRTFFKKEQPEYVFLAAAKVGGIKANNDYPAEFIYKNLMIEANVIHEAYVNKVKKLLFLGSSCIYPRECSQPIREAYLMTGPLEPTNRAYALAKIAGIYLCQSYNKQYGTRFISCMPTNLYGPNDTYDLQNSHVIPGLIAKMERARLNNDPSVKLWGTGRPRREFLHVDDLASACCLLMHLYEGDETVNIGCGEDLQIAELAHLVAEAVGYRGTLEFDTTMPDGTPQKLLDIRIMRTLGWQPKISLKEGLKEAVADYRARFATAPL